MKLRAIFLCVSVLSLGAISVFASSQQTLRLRAVVPHIPYSLKSTPQMFDGFRLTPNLRSGYRVFVAPLKSGGRSPATKDPQWQPVTEPMNLRSSCYVRVLAP